MITCTTPSLIVIILSAFLINNSYFLLFIKDLLRYYNSIFFKQIIFLKFLTRIKNIYKDNNKNVKIITYTISFLSTSVKFKILILKISIELDFISLIVESLWATISVVLPCKYSCINKSTYNIQIKRQKITELLAQKIFQCQ